LSLTQILGKRGCFEIASGFIEHYSKNYFIIISVLLVNNGSSCACSCRSSASAKALLWDIHNKVNNYLSFIYMMHFKFEFTLGLLFLFDK